MAQTKGRRHKEEPTINFFEKEVLRMKCTDEIHKDNREEIPEGHIETLRLCFKLPSKYPQSNIAPLGKTKAITVGVPERKVDRSRRDLAKQMFSPFQSIENIVLLVVRGIN
ncbi:hypothetical protein J6590_097207 [Homalodisca vitripennis]|nr:hypothetical protein J6590_097207 [Homalodisca vitripennis]